MPAIQKKLRRLRVADIAANIAHGFVDVPVGDGEVEPAIEIDVEERAAEAQAISRCDAHAGLRRDIFEALAAPRYRPIISLSKFVIATPGMPELSKSATSTPIPARALPSLLKASPASTADVLECSVALVAVELVGLRVVGDEQIGPAVAVIVEQRDAERLRTAVENSAARGDIFKRSIAAIVKQPAGRSAIRFGRAIGFVLAVEAAEHIVLGRPLHIVADEEIEQAVAVIVEPQRGCAESLALAETAGDR